MKILINLYFLILLSTLVMAQQSVNITFQHDGLTVYGTFTTPNGSGLFPTIIINAGSGANDRDGTLPMLGANIACLYPGLLNDTLRPYKELADALVDSGYAVLRYDKLEYTYTSTIGTITFHKVWLPVESAINYVKTRNDVDTNRIILIGHSEGSSLIPFIAKGRSDVRALISIAGARTPLDSLMAYQIVNIAQTCGGNVPQAQSQANQILSYFNIIRTNTWNAGTPTLFGVPASAWYEYVLATDSVSINYNLNNLPTLFMGMGLDINVPPAELVRLQNEVIITNDFWSIAGHNHYMTPNNDPHVSAAITDTIIFWLRQQGLSTGVDDKDIISNSIQLYPNPANDHITIKMENAKLKNASFSIHNAFGQTLLNNEELITGNNNSAVIDLNTFSVGIYFIELNIDGVRVVKRFLK